MNKSNLILTLFATGASIVGFNEPNNHSEIQMVAKKSNSLIGKKGLLTFPEMQAEVTYISETTLHWKVTTKEGKVMEETEKISYQEVSKNLHFLNWIEKSGLTVSQIIDTKKGTVKAFWSYNDEKSENGKRSAMFVDAKFQFIQ